jgi:hypothetical protein
MDVTVEMPTMDTNGFMKTISQMRPALFTRLEGGITAKTAVRWKCAETASRARLVMFLNSTTFTVWMSMVTFQVKTT